MNNWHPMNKWKPGENVSWDKWTLIDWDGNHDLHLKCYRKRFGNSGGHVSVGVGDFHLICYSYGANSARSMSSTRWRKDRILTEQEAMKLVDEHKGICT